MACSCHAVHGIDVRTGGASAPFAEPGAIPRHPPSRRCRILRADVSLWIDPESGRYEGQTRFEIESRAAWDGRLRLDLDGPTVSLIQGEDELALVWTTVDGGIEVHLPIAAGDRTTVTLRYQGSKPPAGLYFVGPSGDHPERERMAWTQCQDEDARFFMPCHGEPGVRHPWTISLRAPAGYTLLSNGRRVAEGTDGQGAWARFEQAEPMPAYLFTVVVARLDVIEADAGGVPVRYLVPSGFAEHGRRSMGRTPEMIAELAERTRTPFPWPRYDQVVVWDFAFGGMENTACTTMTELLLVDDRSGEHWPPEGLVVHELAHQWFGDLVTCEDWSQAWLNESFATFCEVVWWERSRDEAEATWYAWHQLQDYLEEDRTRYRRPIVSREWREPVDVFDHHLYEKGALVLRTLRAELGASSFWRGVEQYLLAGSHWSVHTRDLQHAMEEVTGLSLGGFFEQWVERAGHPVLDVRLGEEPGLLLVGVRQRQDGADTPAVYTLQLRVEVVLRDDTTLRFDLPLRERERTFAVPVSTPVKTVRVDPGFEVLADLVVDGPPPWIEALALDPAPVVALRALRALTDRGTPSAVAIVHRAVSEHPFWGVRAEAAGLVARLGGSTSLAVLQRALDFELEPRARAAIATALGAFARSEAADALIKAARGPTSTWHEQGAILAALGRTRDPRARAEIEPFLAVRSWSEVVIARALAGLAATEDPGVIDLIEPFAAPDRAERIAAGAASALGALGAAVPSLRTRARRVLVELALHGPFRGRVAAVGALARLRDPAAAGALEHLHRSDPDGRVRRQAHEALVAVRAGGAPGEEVGALRSRLDLLAMEQERLRGRLDRVERVARRT